jgi:hypothetical protein
MPDWDRSAGPARTRDHGAGVFLQVGAGVLLVPLLHVVAGLAMGGLAVAVESAGPVGGAADLLRPLPFLWLMGIGLGQLPYVLPAAIGLWFVRRPIALGVVIGAALTFTLNGACFGLLFGSDLLR